MGEETASTIKNWALSLNGGGDLERGRLCGEGSLLQNMVRMSGVGSLVKVQNC